MAAKPTGTPVRVRMAPSPTGPFHVGGARTALFNWLFARQHGGAFILRIEDTDKARSEKKFEEELLDGLAWLGLTWDEGPLADGGRLPVADEKGNSGPYRQSERSALYKKYLERLLADGNAYYCYCTKEELEAQRDAMAAQGLPPKYSGRCRALAAPPAGKTPEVIRFKIPEETVEFKDLVRGKVSFDASLFGDIVIAKSLDEPLYNFAAAVDDELMAVSHVIRGEDHLANTPKQILLQRALGFRTPAYGHIPLILNPDRTKMSKRFADTALAEYRRRGYLPEALVNFLALLGWHPKDDREILSVKELVKEFDLARVQPSGAVWNEEKLGWLNREHMKQLSDKKLAALAAPFFAEARLAASAPFLAKVVAVERSRAKTLRDLAEQGRFFFALPDYDPELLIGKESSHDEARETLVALRDRFMKIDANAFTRETISAVITFLIEGGVRRGAVLWPLRVALSGLRASPDPLDIIEVLGKEESLKRFSQAIAKLSA